MPNERLRALLLEQRITPAKLAEAVDVDPKTIERWIVGGRVPYRRHRFNVAAFFGVDESYIWPDALGRDEIVAASESEKAYMKRSGASKRCTRRLPSPCPACAGST